MELVGHLLEFQNHPTPDFPANFTANLMSVLVETLPLVKVVLSFTIYVTFSGRGLSTSVLNLSEYVKNWKQI